MNIFLKRFPTKVAILFTLISFSSVIPLQASFLALLEGSLTRTFTTVKSRPIHYSQPKTCIRNHPLLVPVRHLSTTHQQSLFLDPKNDIAFKKLFATTKHKPLLVSFLNSILRLSGPRTIKEVELVPTELIPKVEEAKRSVLDVKCTDQRNFQYIVEMQNKRLPNFFKRAQYYVANTYAGQLGKAVDYLDLKPVILLAIMDYEAFPDKNSHTSFHKILDEETNEHILKDMSFAFVELPKFRKSLDQVTSIEDQWLYLFRNYNQLKSAPPLISKEIEEAYKSLDRYSWSRSEREAYDKADMALADELDALRGEHLKGREEGEESKARAIALQMLAANEDLEKVSTYTGLSREELLSLRSNKD